MRRSSRRRRFCRWATAAAILVSLGSVCLAGPPDATAGKAKQANPGLLKQAIPPSSGTSAQPTLPPSGSLSGMKRPLDPGAWETKSAKILLVDWRRPALPPLS